MQNIYFVEEYARAKKYIDTSVGWKDNMQFFFDKKELPSDCSVVMNFTPANSLSTILINKAKCSKILTVLLSDGIVDFSNIYDNPNHIRKNINIYDPIIEDVFFCFGEKSKSFISMLNPSTVVETYVPKFMKFKCDIYNDNCNQQEKIKKYDFLITTANTPYFDKKEKERLIVLLECVKKVIEKNNYKVCYRIFNSDIVDSLSITPAMNNIDDDFSSVASSVKAVITTPSTIMIECMLLGLPVASLIYRDTPILNETAWYLCRDVNIDKTLSSMLVQDKKRLIYQKLILSNYMKDCKSDDVSDGMIDTINKYYNDYSLIGNLDDRKEQFIYSSYKDILESKFNFNIKYFIKKIYLACKKSKK